MASSIKSFISNWKSLFIGESITSTVRIKSGNFYKIIVYKYVDGKVRVLSGTKTSYVFALGTYTSDKTKYAAVIKLSNVDPKWFMQDIKQALHHKPLTKKEIDEVYAEASGNDNVEFSSLLKRFPKDGRPLFNLIKTKRRTYVGNYREYKLSSIKSVSYVDVNPDYLKLTLTTGAGKQANKEKAADMINTRDSKVAKEAAKPNG